MAAARIALSQREESIMGTWDIGPFENDMAADFADALDEASEGDRETLVRAALINAVQTREYLESPEGSEVVAAAAIIAAQYPGGDPISTIYGPSESLPTFAADLRPLAVEALDRVVAENSELAELWDETADGPTWRQTIRRIRAVLEPEAQRQEDPLFDLQPVFWTTDSGVGVQPDLTDQAILEAERLLNVTLPASLLDLLHQQNGGLVVSGREAFPTSQATSWASDHVPFDNVMGIGRRERTLSLLDSPYLVEEWGLPADVVLLSGAGHYWIGLDYRTCGRHGEPSVVWFDTDDHSELPLAPDFRSFTEGLTAASGFDDERSEVSPG